MRGPGADTQKPQDHQWVLFSATEFVVIVTSAVENDSSVLLGTGVVDAVS